MGGIVIFLGSLFILLGYAFFRRRKHDRRYEFLEKALGMTYIRNPNHHRNLVHELYEDKFRFPGLHWVGGGKYGQLQAILAGHKNGVDLQIAEKMYTNFESYYLFVLDGKWRLPHFEFCPTLGRDSERNLKRRNLSNEQYPYEELGHYAGSMCFWKVGEVNSDHTLKASELRRILSDLIKPADDDFKDDRKQFCLEGRENRLLYYCQLSSNCSVNEVENVMHHVQEVSQMFVRN